MSGRGPGGEVVKVVEMDTLPRDNTAPADGLALYRLGRTRRALPHLSQQFAAEREGAAPLCTALTMLGRWQEAVAVARQAPALGPSLEAEALLNAAEAAAGAARRRLLAASEAPAARAAGLDPARDRWLAGLRALVLNDPGGALEAFARGGALPAGADAVEATWYRCSMRLCVALSALDRGPSGAAERAAVTYLEAFEDWPGLHPGKLKPDRHLVCLWLRDRGSRLADEALVARLDRERRELLEHGVRTSDAEIAVYEAAHALLAGGGDRAALRSALRGDVEGCLVKRRFIRPTNLRLV